MFVSFLLLVDRIGYIEYTYHEDTRSFEAKAWTKKSGGVLVSHNKVEFDDRGDLAADWQSIGMEIGVSTPRTSYSWDTRYTTTGVAGHRRLGSMLYPAPPHGPPSAGRTVSFHYGVADSLDDRLSRLTSIATDKGPVAEVARFGHVGSSRRAWMSRGDDRILQGFGLVDDPGSLSTGIGLHGLDRFGRVTELAYNERTSSGATGPSLVNLEYAYDIAGNRTSSVRTPRPGAASPTDTRDETNAYDPFNRLTAWLTEHTTGSGTSFVRADEWDLDLLGNWLQRETELPGSVITTVAHAPDARNRITAVTEQTTGGTPDLFEPVYDAAGNLIFDGHYAYQYDAWNRLVQVNAATATSTEVQLDHLVKHHTYDALGRLVRTQSPHPDPQTSNGQLRSERFYYDGVRRIQEVLVDPLDDMDEALGDPQGSSLVLQTVGAETYELDGKSAPAVFEMAQTGEDDEEDPGDPGDPGEPGGPDRWLDREYIWGPGDRGLDELLVQYDRHGLPSWPVQDQGNDAIALLDLGGVDGAPRVVAEWVYDPYGKVVAADTILQELPSLRVGHKGLFVDRLDAAVDAPRLVTGARILYHNRNRTVDPDSGRFFQEDPNATALALLMSQSHHGAALAADINPFDLEGRYTDGANLYGYLGSNPMTNSDPMGLFFLPTPADAVMVFVGGMRGGLSEMIGQYGDNMLADVEWALDWSMGDDWHTRLDNSWVSRSFARGFHNGMMEQIEAAIPFMGHGHAMASGARKLARTKRLGKIQQIRDINRLEIHSSRSAARSSPSRRSGDHAHHIVEKQIGQNMPWRQRAGEGDFINLPSRFHLSTMRMTFNDAYRQLGIANPKNMNRSQALQVVELVYGPAPRILNAARSFINSK